MSLSRALIEFLWFFFVLLVLFSFLSFLINSSSYLKYKLHSCLGGCCCDCNQDSNTTGEKVRLQVVMQSPSGNSTSPQARVIVAPDSSHDDTESEVVVGKNKHIIHASSDGLLLDGNDHENVTLLWAKEKKTDSVRKNAQCGGCCQFIDWKITTVYKKNNDPIFLYHVDCYFIRYFLFTDYIVDRLYCHNNYYC